MFILAQTKYLRSYILTCRLGTDPAEGWYTTLHYFCYPWRVGYDTGFPSKQGRRATVVVVKVNTEWPTYYHILVKPRLGGQGRVGESKAVGHLKEDTGLLVRCEGPSPACLLVESFVAGLLRVTFLVSLSPVWVPAHAVGEHSGEGGR